MNPKDKAVIEKVKNLRISIYNKVDGVSNKKDSYINKHINVNSKKINILEI